VIRSKTAQFTPRFPSPFLKIITRSDFENIPELSYPFCHGPGVSTLYALLPAQQARGVSILLEFNFIACRPHTCHREPGGGAGQRRERCPCPGQGHCWPRTGWCDRGGRDHANSRHWSPWHHCGIRRGQTDVACKKPGRTIGEGNPSNPDRGGGGGGGCGPH
jgi:hypothetical protein